MKSARRLAAIAVFLLAGSAWAAEDPVRAGDDEIALKNGGMVRGTVIEIDPPKQVTVLIDATGERRMIPWREVGQVERGKYLPGGHATADSQASGAVASSSSSFPDKGDKGLVRLHLAGGPAPLNLFLSRPVADQDEVVCTAPCDREVDGRAGQEFYVGGEGLVRTDRFNLLGREGALEMQVRAGNRTARRLGLAGSITGAALVSAGLLVLSVAATPNGDEQNGRVNDLNLTTAQRRGMRWGGGAAVVVGAALAATGLYEFFHNRTSFEVSEAK